MFPFSKKPLTKVEVVKQSVSEAAQALLHAIPAEKIEDKLDELKKSAAQVALQAAQAAHHAGEVASHKIDELQHAASHLNTDSAAKAQAARETLQGHASTLKDSASALQATVQSTWRDRAAREAARAQDEADEAKEEVKEAHSEAETAAHLEEQAARAAAKAAQQNLVKHDAEIEAQKHFEAARLKAQEAKEKAKSEARQRAQAQAEAAKVEAERFKIAEIEAAKAEAAKKEAAKEKVKEKAELEKKKLDAAAAAAAALSKAKSAKDEVAEGFKVKSKRDLKLKAGPVEVAELDLRPGKDRDVEIEYADSASKWGWILVGLIAGAVLALLFAPTSGRRSRAAIKDRLGKVGDGAADAATAASDKIGDIANRVEGLAAQIDTKAAADAATDDDSTIADRVRSVLGHHEVARTIDRINLDCAEGVVTLRGPLLDEATQATIIAAVKTVPGVKDVVAEFLTDEKPADPSTSVI
ncbi:MAG TPA: YtxH domain-containing protein [Abditibacterium sp.]|jgi:gas vesicle protein